MAIRVVVVGLVARHNIVELLRRSVRRSLSSALGRSSLKVARLPARRRLPRSVRHADVVANVTHVPLNPRVRAVVCFPWTPGSAGPTSRSGVAAGTSRIETFDTLLAYVPPMERVAAAKMLRGSG